MAETKNCKQCNAEFVTSDDDIGFLAKISPDLDGKKYLIDGPKLCRDCRQIRRLIWRNERALYKRKSDKSGSEIISIYSPDKTNYIIYSIDEYQADDWDAIEYGTDYDLNQSFFEQFEKLTHKVPRKSSNSIRNENSEFCNQTWQSKNSYLCFNVGYAENCYYCTESFHVNNCTDCFDVRNCEFCFGCFDCSGCNNCQYLDHCKDCSESYFSYDCSGCQNIFLSSGLKKNSLFLRTVN